MLQQFTEASQFSAMADRLIDQVNTVTFCANTPYRSKIAQVLVSNVAVMFEGAINYQGIEFGAYQINGRLKQSHLRGVELC